MIISSVSIKKFRGFEDIQIELGENLTIIAGQNGTQKTTLLGMITQPFTITDKKNPLYGEKPLCGGNYKSLFREKFKLSESFDIPKNHEWTLNLPHEAESQFTVESIKRGASANSFIRFWQKGDRSKGSGYIQLPVIFLSLSRLIPIGEDSTLNASNEVNLDDEEFKFYKKWHNKILLLPDVELTSADYLQSKKKNTLGANTSYYDWKMNSAGQDNLGKILLAILSFKRLKEKHGVNYKGGILAIDESDATLYPASQLKLIEALRKFSNCFNIQIVFTTHSLTILKQACEWQQEKRFLGQVKVIYLQKIDQKLKAIPNITYAEIRDKLNVVLSEKPRSRKIPIFTEDKEGEYFLRAIIKRNSSAFSFQDCSLGCNNLIELVKKKIPGFRIFESIVVLDGDVSAKKAEAKKVKGLENIILLPGSKSPEGLLADFLIKLSENSIEWDKVYQGYSKQIVFKDFSHDEIQSDRLKAKQWFNEQKKYWGRNCVNVINLWIAANEQEVETFVVALMKIVDRYKKQFLIEVV